MGLIGNHSVLNKSCAFFTNGTSTAGAYAAVTRSNWKNPSRIRSQDIFFEAKISIPYGYGPGVAFRMARSDGGIGSFTRVSGSSTIDATLWEVKLATADLSGVGTISVADLASLVPSTADLTGVGIILDADLKAVSALVADLSGSGAISDANLSANIPITANLTGSGSISGAELSGYGSLSADIEIGPVFTGVSPSDVWNYDISAISTSGTSGKKLNDASAAGNPWEAELVDNNTEGTFGWFVQKLLTVAKFLGLK